MMFLSFCETPLSGQPVRGAADQAEPSATARTGPLRALFASWTVSIVQQWGEREATHRCGSELRPWEVARSPLGARLGAGWSRLGAPRCRLLGTRLVWKQKSRTSLGFTPEVSQTEPSETRGTPPPPGAPSSQLNVQRSSSAVAAQQQHRNTASQHHSITHYHPATAALTILRCTSTNALLVALPPPVIDGSAHPAETVGPASCSLLYPSTPAAFSKSRVAAAWKS